MGEVGVVHALKLVHFVPEAVAHAPLDGAVRLEVCREGRLGFEQITDKGVMLEASFVSDETKAVGQLDSNGGNNADTFVPCA